eukprot:gene4319-biopygen869
MHRGAAAATTRAAVQRDCARRRGVPAVPNGEGAAQDEVRARGVGGMREGGVRAEVRRLLRRRADLLPLAGRRERARLGAVCGQHRAGEVSPARWESRLSAQKRQNWSRNGSTLCDRPY